MFFDKLYAPDGSQGGSDNNVNPLLDAFNLPDNSNGQQKPTTESKPNVIEILPQFKGLPPLEAITRSAQSQIDSLKSTVMNLTVKEEELLGKARFLNELNENKDLRFAYFAKLDPDLFQIDTDSLVEKELQKEFGKDFTPVQEERDDPKSKTAKYYRRYYKLYDEVESRLKNTDVEKILSEKETTKKKEKEKLDEKIAKIKAEENWDDNKIEEMFSFVKSVNNDLFAWKKLFKFAIAQKPNSRFSPGASHSGGQYTPDQMLAAVDAKFGPAKSKLSPKRE